MKKLPIIPTIKRKLVTIVVLKEQMFFLLILTLLDGSQCATDYC